MNPATRTLLTEALPLLRNPAVVDLVATALVSGASSFGDLALHRRSLDSTQDPLGYWVWYAILSSSTASRHIDTGFSHNILRKLIDAELEAQHNAAK
jgi:hypothetical protein